MTICLGKSCSFGSFVNCCRFYVFSYFPFGFEGMWDLIVSVPDHCFSFYLIFLIRDVLTLIVQNRYHYLACRAKQPR